MKKLIILALIGVVLFSSGCVNLPWGNQGTTTTGGYGLVVNYFEPDFSNLESGDDFQIEMEVQNMGGATAEDIYTYLYGITPSDWGLSESDLGKEIGNLEPPDENVGLPGEIDSVKWGLTAPNIPEGITYTYTPRARVMYKYHTVATSVVTTLSRDEYSRLRQKNEVPSGQPQTTVSKGPLSVSVSARNPVILDSPEDTIRVIITVGTLGQGSVFDYNKASDCGGYEGVADINTTCGLNSLEMKIVAPGTTAKDCGALDNYRSVDLRRGQSLTYSCELDPGDITTRKDIPITVYLRYGYMEDFSTTLTVTGTSDVTSGTVETTTTTQETTTTTVASTTTTTTQETTTTTVASTTTTTTD